MPRFGGNQDILRVYEARHCPLISITWHWGATMNIPMNHLPGSQKTVY